LHGCTITVVPNYLTNVTYNFTFTNTWANVYLFKKGQPNIYYCLLAFGRAFGLFGENINILKKKFKIFINVVFNVCYIRKYGSSLNVGAQLGTHCTCVNQRLQATTV